MKWLLPKNVWLPPDVRDTHNIDINWLLTKPNQASYRLWNQIIYGYFSFSWNHSDIISIMLTNLFRKIGQLLTNSLLDFQVQKQLIKNIFQDTFLRSFKKKFNFKTGSWTFGCQDKLPGKIVKIFIPGTRPIKCRPLHCYKFQLWLINHEADNLQAQ